MKNDSTKNGSMNSSIVKKSAIKSSGVNSSIKKNAMKNDTMKSNSIKNNNVKNNRIKSDKIQGNNVKRNDKTETNPKLKNAKGSHINSGNVKNNSIRNGYIKGTSTKDSSGKAKCPVFGKCGGCQYLDAEYQEMLRIKQQELKELFGKSYHVHPVVGMENPYHYRNKVHAVFDHDRKGQPISGVYREGTHEVIPVEECLIEDKKSGEIIQTVKGLLKSFKIRTYDEDTGYGLLRHVLVRRGFATGQIMVVLVTASPVFPSKNNFVRALREKHPEITTIVQNINGRGTSMVLGNKEHVLFGRGYIEDVLCGCTFRISSRSFYQVNPVQTEKLYQKALELAELQGAERVVDAYCGIGTIGIIAAKTAKEVIGVELNADAVHDAVINAKQNHCENIRFYCKDAGDFLVEMAEQGEHADVVILDPPRSGSTEMFMDCVAKLAPKKVVYVSCGPDTLARDLKYFAKLGYKGTELFGFDLFPFTKHVETVISLSK